MSNNTEQPKSGLQLIADERQDQITKHGRTIEQDKDFNIYHQLCVGASRLLFSPSDEGEDLMKEPLFKPVGWDMDIWHKMVNKPYEQRLIIAGALIAAELDRINGYAPTTPQPVQSVEDRNKYHFAREIIYNLKTCNAISDKVYLHWIDKLINDEKQSTPLVEEFDKEAINKEMQLAGIIFQFSELNPSATSFELAAHILKCFRFQSPTAQEDKGEQWVSVESGK